MLVLSLTMVGLVAAVLDSFDLEQLFQQIAQIGQMDQRMPIWGWAILVVILLLLLRALRNRRKRRGTKARSRSSRGPRDSRGPVTRHDNVPQPGRYGPTATCDLALAEIEALRPEYAPAPNGYPDPGEIIWTWVPYSEGNNEGKDRPVLIIARIDARNFAGCYLSTKQHPGYIPIGSGAWDRSGRQSYVAPERVLRVHNLGVRREGTVLPRSAYDKAVAEIAATQKRVRISKSRSPLA